MMILDFIFGDISEEQIHKSKPIETRDPLRKKPTCAPPEPRSPPSILGPYYPLISLIMCFFPGNRFSSSSQPIDSISFLGF